MDIKLTLNDQERQALLDLIDAATRQLGAQAARPVAHFLGKIEEAMKAAQEADAQRQRAAGTNGEGKQPATE
jgi:hypothetical protein